MRRRWGGLTALAVLITCALPAQAQTPGPEAGASATPPVDAAPPAYLAAVLERLPPYARPTTQRGLSWVRAEGDAPFDARQLEVVGNPDPADGAPEWVQVEYTVDPDLDERVRQVLDRRGVTLANVILMDPESGGIFAYVSSEPETFPATRAYPTASLMKVVTAAAALQRLPDFAERPCRYRGSPYHVGLKELTPPRVGGQVDPLRRALAMSNNQCFGRLAVHELGADVLLDEMRRVGLLEAPGAHHAAGRVEPIEGELDLAYLGSGLAGSFVSPLGAARLAALLAKGELVSPHWIARVRDARGEPLALPPAPPPRAVWPSRVARELRALMVDVTESGTARKAFVAEDGAPLLDPLRVSGKTGTLSGTDPEGVYHWFIGVAPAEQPSVAVAALVLDGPPAGAAGVAADCLREIFCRDGPCTASGGEQLRAGVRARESVARRDLASARNGELDAPPRPLDFHGFDFPPRLLRKRASGRIVLLVDLDAAGTVQDVAVDESDLPDFEAFVTSQVRGWRFTPPLRGGQPVPARARLPIPIRVE